MKSNKFDIELNASWDFSMTLELYRRAFDDIKADNDRSHKIKLLSNLMVLMEEQNPEIHSQTGPPELLVLYREVSIELQSHRLYQHLDSYSTYSNTLQPDAQTEQLAHFNIDPRPKAFYEELLKCLMINGWIPENVSVADWLFRLTGQYPEDGNPSKEQIKFSWLNQCRYIVKNLIFNGSDVSNEQWQKATQVFAVKNGTISNIQTASKTPSGSDKIDPILKKIRTFKG